MSNAIDAIASNKDPEKTGQLMGDLFTGAVGAKGAGSLGQVKKASIIVKVEIKKGELASSKGLVGTDFEGYLHNKLGGKSSFKFEGREFDGAYGTNNSIWYEAKSGNYWRDQAAPDTKGFEKFKSDVGHHAQIARKNGASFEVHSNTPIPQHVRDWLSSKGIDFKEYK